MLNKINKTNCKVWVASCFKNRTLRHTRVQCDVSVFEEAFFFRCFYVFNRQPFGLHSVPPRNCINFLNSKAAHTFVHQNDCQIQVKSLFNKVWMVTNTSVQMSLQRA